MKEIKRVECEQCGRMHWLVDGAYCHQPDMCWECYRLTLPLQLGNNNDDEVE
jgi:hypothetical protein